MSDLKKLFKHFDTKETFESKTVNDNDICFIGSDGYIWTHDTMYFEDDNKYQFRLKQTLSNATSDTSKNIIYAADALTITITADSGYGLEEVQVDCGGIDMLDEYYEEIKVIRRIFLEDGTPIMLEDGSDEELYLEHPYCVIGKINIDKIRSNVSITITGLDEI